MAAELPRLRALASAAGGELVESRDTAHLTAAARRAVAEGVERLVVAGGDGTIHHAVQALAGSPCALAVLPLGSGNDIAASLGLPPELEAAAELARTGPVRRIDLGRLDGRYYAGVAGVGFDSAANQFANERVRRLKGPAVYLWAVLHTLVTFRPPNLSARWQGGRFEGRVMLVVLANGPRFGGGMRVAPQAELDDGQLDLVLVRRVSRPTFLRVFPRVYSGRHLAHPAVVAARTPWAEVRLDREMRAYGDGEPLLPVSAAGVRFEAVPGALSAVVGEVPPPG